MTSIHDSGSASSRPDGHEPLSLEGLGAWLVPGRQNVMLNYVLYLLGVIPAFGIMPIIIAFVMALINRDKAGYVDRTHYEYQVRQGVMALAFIAISLVLVLVLVGFVGFVLIAVWWIVRSVKGLLAANHGEAIADPRTWAW